jgi:drug/metabolite transporter (DMT)-like permease
MIWFTFALSSALLSAAAAVLQKKVLFRMSALEFSFCVSACILFVSLLAPFTVDVASVPRPMLSLIIGKSTLGAAAFLLVMMSLEKNQISSALPLLGLTPAAAAFLSMPALGESLRLWEWTAIGLMMGGTYLIEKKPSQKKSSQKKIDEPLADAVRSTAHYPIIGAVVLFAVSTVADKTLVSGYGIHPLAVLFYQHIVYCAVFGVCLAVRTLARRTVPAQEQPPSLLRTCRAQFPLIAAVALITIAYRFAQLEATKEAPAALVLAVKRTSIVFASFYGGKLFSDEHLTVKLIGAVLIAGSGFLILRFIA